ncbi:MAG TPA: histidine phosphatase family protein [Chloroflexota bacterium]|nr:histidine phosphatase family protein [Chloroflexota bacterium]
MTDIILCRHGETEWNREGRYQGKTDIPLNGRGREQARQLAASLRDEPIAAVYSSTLARAYETGVEIARLHGLEVKRDPRLDEINQGLWEGLRREEIVLTHAELHERWLGYPLDLRLPEGETLDEVLSRVRSALDDILLLHPSHAICIVAHSVSMAVIKHELQGLSLAEALGGLPKNASWERIGVGKRAVGA